MKLIKHGATRWVLLIGNYAIKFPAFHGYRNFLQGILGNEQESHWYRELKWTNKLCPILFAFPGYLFIVMPRVRVMTDQEAETMWGWDPEELAPNQPTPIDGFLRIQHNELGQFPVEKKSDSFGWLNGNLVIIDYGS